jgi:hypothetical protein
MPKSSRHSFLPKKIELACLFLVSISFFVASHILDRVPTSSASIAFHSNPLAEAFIVFSCVLGGGIGPLGCAIAGFVILLALWLIPRSLLMLAMRADEKFNNGA